MKQKTLKQQIEEAKKEGNDLYKKQDLVGAAKTYESALKLCTKYREAEEAGEVGPPGRPRRPRSGAEPLGPSSLPRAAPNGLEAACGAREDLMFTWCTSSCRAAAGGEEYPSPLPPCTGKANDPRPPRSEEARLAGAPPGDLHGAPSVTPRP